ncbi:MAG: putative molybdenum carrier protein [Cyanobacteria bacterium J06643_5]
MGSAYKPHTKESGASATLLNSNEKLQLHQFAFYYPNEKTDLKAAYQALIYSLDAAKQQEYKFVKIETSNNNLYQRLKGNPNYMHFAGKNSECEALHKQALELSKSFAWGVESKFISSKHFSTAHNADKIAYDAICQKCHSPNVIQRLSEIEKLPYTKPLVPLTNLVPDKEGGSEGVRERGRVNWLESKNLIQLSIPYRQCDFKPFCLDDKNSFKIGNFQSCYGTNHEDSITSNSINSVNEHSKSNKLKTEISEGEISADTKDSVINQAQESDKEPAKLPSNLNSDVSSYSKHSQSSNSKNSSSLRILGITSIGQFGADLGALEAAKNKGISTGGIAANGFLTERGSRTDLYEYYGLVQGEPGKGFGQTYKNAYAANIRHTDATVLIGRILNRTDSTEKDLLSIINRYNRPYLIIPKEDILINPENAASQIAQFAVRHNVKSLNIIGERESHAPGIQAATQKAIEKALELNTQAQKDINKEGESEGVRERDEISNEEKTEHKSFNTSEITNYETKSLNTDTSKDYDDSPENVNTEIKNQGKKEGGSEGVRERGRGNNQGKHDKEINIGQIEHAEHKISVMVNILKKKLIQYPHLVEKINQSGGTQFLEDKIRISSCKDGFWNGFGLESPFINALSIAYSEIISKTQNQITTHDAKSVDDSFKYYKNDPSSELKNDSPLMSCKETIELLQEWTVNAKFLNRSYLNTIYKIQNDYLENSNPLTNIQLQTMINDSNKANQVSSAINFVNHLMDTSYTNLREDNSKAIEGNNYIIEAKQDKGFIRIIDKNSFDILLYVENHKIQTENLNNDLLSSLESAFKASEKNEVQSIHEVRRNKEEGRNSNDLGN